MITAHLKILGTPSIVVILYALKTMCYGAVFNNEIPNRYFCF